MKLRFEIDLTITVLTAIIFQYFLVGYGSAFTVLTNYAVANNIIGNTVTEYADTDPVYIKFLELLDLCGNQLNVVNIVSYSQLILPLSELWDFYFTYKTKRKASNYGVDKLNEITLFLVVAVWFYIKLNWQKYDETIGFAHPNSTPT